MTITSRLTVTVTTYVRPLRRERQVDNDWTWADHVAAHTSPGNLVWQWFSTQHAAWECKNACLCLRSHLTLSTLTRWRDHVLLTARSDCC